MASNNAFTNQGATPPSGLNIGQSSNFGSGPFGSALSKLSIGALSGSGVQPQGIGGGSTSSQRPPSVQLPTAPTGQDVKSHTVTNTDGSTVSQTYHPKTTGLINPTPTTPTTPPAAPANPLASNVSTLTGLANGNNSTASTAQTGLLNTQANGNPQAPAQTGLMNIAANGSPEVTAAQDQYNKLATNNPLLLSEVANDPNTAASVASGRGQALGQVLSAQQQAAAQNVTNALGQQGQKITAGNEAGNLALTGQGQGITAGTNAGNLALTGQGQNISAATNAGNLSSPASQFGVLTNPTTGLPISPGSPKDIAAAGGAVQGAQAAAASNAQTAGTAGVNANQSVFNKAYSDYTTLNQAVQNVDQFGSTLVNGMVDKDTGQAINPSDSKYANMTIAAVRNQLSSPQQAQFDTTLAALKSKISGLLSIGGNEIPTQITADANAIMSGTAPLKTINATLARIQTEGNILLKNQADLVNTSYAGTQGQNQGGSQSSQGSPDYGSF